MLFKKIFLVVILVVSFGYSQARILHACIFTYNNAKDIQESCSIDSTHIVNQLKRISKAIDYQYQQHFLESFSIKSVDEVVESLSDAAADDIVIVYMSTHGQRFTTDTSKFPDVLIPNENVLKPFPSYTYFYDRIKKLPSRLNLFIVDACNDYVMGGFAPGENGSLKRPMSDKIENLQDEIITNYNDVNFQKLFLKYEGNLFISSSDKGQTSTATTNGSLFTLCFLKSLAYYASLDPQKLQYVTWNNIMDRADTLTRQESKIFNSKDQSFQIFNPIWENSLHPPKFDVNIDKPEYFPKIALVHQTRKMKFVEKLKRGTKLSYLLDYWIQAPENQLNLIDSVQYKFFSTNNPPIHATNDPSNSFSQEFAIDGFFWLKATIYFKDKTNMQMTRYVSIDNSFKGTKAVQNAN